MLSSATNQLHGRITWIHVALGSYEERRPLSSSPLILVRTPSALWHALASQTDRAKPTLTDVFIYFFDIMFLSSLMFV